MTNHCLPSITLHYCEEDEPEGAGPEQNTSIIPTYATIQNFLDHAHGTWINQAKEPVKTRIKSKQKGKFWKESVKTVYY
jgi:hypothetical protein